MKNRRIHQGQVIGTGEKVFNAGMAILGIVISLVVLYPIYYVLIASLSQPYYVENGDVMFAIRHFTLASYKEAIKKSGIWLAYGNTIFYTVAGVVVNRRPWPTPSVKRSWFSASSLPYLPYSPCGLTRELSPCT